MKKEEILKERIWVMPLHAILRVLDKLPGDIITILILSPVVVVGFVIYIALLLSPMTILLLLSLYLSYVLGFSEGVATGISTVVICAAVGISDRILKKTEKKVFSWIGRLNVRSRILRYCNPNLSSRLLQHYEKRWGITNEEIKDYISHRAQLGDDVSISHLLPFVSQLCQLNKGAREEQEMFLSNFLSEDEIEYIFNMEYSYSQMEESYQYWREKEMGEKKYLMELLFKFTIEQDGIHNDEWKMLMQIMAQLKFNENYFYYFKNRYFSLRTEFDDYERKDTSSLGEYSTASLEPYYAVLGLEKDASIEEIKRAYHELAMQHHPDLPKNANRKEECEAKMMEINEAYEKVRG